MGPTFCDTAAAYLRHLEPELARSTFLSYQSALNRYWLPAFGDLLIATLTVEQVLAAWDNIAWQTRKTAKNNLIPLHGVFRFAFERGLIDTNPAARIRVRKTRPPRMDPFTADEKARILARLATDAESIAHQFFLANFETGARTGELLALRWSDYDGKGLWFTKTLTRRRIKDRTKTNVDRYVIATRRLRAALDAASPGTTDTPMFPNTQGRHMLDADWLNRRWRAALATEQIRYRRAYNCRHTYATLGLMAGVEPALLAQQLGHSVEIFHRNYARWLPRPEDEAEILRMERYWDAQ